VQRAEQQRATHGARDRRRHLGDLSTWPAHPLETCSLARILTQLRSLCASSCELVSLHFLFFFGTQNKTHTMFASLDMMMLAGLAFDTNGRFIGLCRSAFR
jgi:hypothetical protein